MSLNLHLPDNIILKPSITVFGVGGAGGNAVNNMISAHLEGVDFVAANTDAQALEHSLTDNRIQLGEELTRGLGAGANPEIGGAAAEEAMSEIMEYLQGTNMVFITAGMGGGTGTGAAPVIARAAKEQGVLTVGVVTKPFHFEGAHRMRLADSGVEELQKFVDTLIIIPNQNLFRIANEKTTFADAFKMADSVLHAGVRGITDLMMMPGLINLDFADIRTVMGEMVKAMMGTGEAEGDNRAIEAAEAAIANPLLDNVSMKGAQGVLINITGGSDMTLFEVDEAANRIREEVDSDANIIFGSTFNQEVEGYLRVSVVATGIDAQNAPQWQSPTTVTTSEPKQEAPAFQQPSPQATVAAPVAPVSFEPADVQPSVSYKSETANEEIVFGSPYAQAKEQIEQEEPAPKKVEPLPAFISPPPVEPRYNVESEPVAAVVPPAPTYQEATVQVQKKPAVEPHISARPITAPQPPKSLGLFGRMAAGMGRVTARSSEEDGDVALATRSSDAENLVKNAYEDASINQEVIDVPAFLRKKDD